MIYILGTTLMLTETVWIFVIPNEARNSVCGAAAIIWISFSVMHVKALAKISELMAQMTSLAPVFILVWDFLKICQLALWSLSFKYWNKYLSKNRLECSECLCGFLKLYIQLYPVFLQPLVF